MLILQILQMICLLTSLHCSTAANHYCVDQNTVRFSMRSDTDQSERLLTNIRNREKYAASQLCTWELVIRHLTEPRYLMLQLMTQPIRSYFSDEAGQSLSSCKSTLTVEQSGSNYSREWKNGQSLPHHPLVLPVFTSSQKLVTIFTTGDSEPSADCPRVELNIMLVKKGFCGRNMLMHRSHCHFISDREIGMSDLRETGLRLTSFSSMDDVRHLMRDNELRMQQYPYNRPLDLSSPVRVGVFRCPGSQQVFYWNSSNGFCVSFNSTGLSDLLSVRNPLSSPECAILTVDSRGKLSSNFSDCQSKMLSLLRFPETPSIERNSDDVGFNCCTNLTFIGADKSQNHLKQTDYPRYFIAGIFLAVFFISVIVVISCRHSRQPLYRWQQSSQSRSTRESEYLTI